MAIAAAGSMPMVNGIRRAIAIGELRPGRAPTSTPINTPKTMAVSVERSANMDRPARTGSISVPTDR